MDMIYLKSSWKASHHHHQVRRDQLRQLCWSLQQFILQELPKLLLLVLVIHPHSVHRPSLFQLLPPRVLQVGFPRLIQLLVPLAILVRLQGLELELQLLQVMLGLVPLMRFELHLLQ